MPDYAGLKSLIAGSQFAGMTDAQIAAALTATGITVYSSIAPSLWEGYFFKTGFLLPVEAYAGATPPSGATATAILAAKELGALMTADAAIDLADPTVLSDVQTHLAALVAEGTAGRLVSDITGAPFAASDQAALLAMGTSTTSQAAQLGFTSNNDMVNEIAAARAYP